MAEKTLVATGADAPTVSLDFLNEPAAPKANLPTRNNNPLNLKYGGATKHWVEEGLAEKADKAQDGGNFLKFKDADTGFRAAQELLQGRFASKDIESAMREWSNQGYGAQEVGLGHMGKSTIAQLKPEELVGLIESMAKREGYGGQEPSVDLSFADAAPVSDPNDAWRKLQAERFPTKAESGVEPGSNIPENMETERYGTPAVLGRAVGRALSTAATDIGGMVMHPQDTINGLLDTIGLPQEGMARERSETAVGKAMSQGDYGFATTRGLLNMVPFGPTVGAILDEHALDPARVYGHMLSAKAVPPIAEAAMNPLETIGKAIPSRATLASGLKAMRSFGSGNHVTGALHLMDLLKNTSIGDFLAGKARPLGGLPELELEKLTPHMRMDRGLPIDEPASTRIEVPPWEMPEGSSTQAPQSLQLEDPNAGMPWAPGQSGRFNPPWEADTQPITNRLQMNPNGMVSTRTVPPWEGAEQPIPPLEIQPNVSSALSSQAEPTAVPSWEMDRQPVAGRLQMLPNGMVSKRAISPGEMPEQPITGLRMQQPTIIPPARQLTAGPIITPPPVVADTSAVTASTPKAITTRDFNTGKFRKMLLGGEEAPGTPTAPKAPKAKAPKGKMATKAKLPDGVRYMGEQEMVNGKTAPLYNVKVPGGGETTIMVLEGQDLAAKVKAILEKFKE